jgi:hypothetical protein
MAEPVTVARCLELQRQVVRRLDEGRVPLVRALIEIEALSGVARRLAGCAPVVVPPTPGMPSIASPARKLSRSAPAFRLSRS